MSNPDENLLGYQEAVQFWNLDKLFQDLDQIKGKSLSDTEKEFLCYLLLGNTPKDIAEKRGGKERSVSVELSKKLYPLLKKLLDIEQEGEKSQSIDRGQIIGSLMQRGYLKNTIEIIKSASNEKILDIANDFRWKINEKLRSQTPQRIKQTDYNIIDIQKMTASIVDGSLQITGSWRGQFRDGPLNPGLKLLLRQILPKDIYSGGEYINWIDVDGEFYTTFDLRWDAESGQLKLEKRSVEFSKYNCSKSRVLESLAQVFPDIAIRFSEPLAAFNPLESVDTNQIFTDCCRPFLQEKSKKSQDIIWFQVKGLSINNTQLIVTMFKE
jgi:hypothetical protein